MVVCTSKSVSNCFLKTSKKLYFSTVTQKNMNSFCSIKINLLQLQFVLYFKQLLRLVFFFCNGTSVVLNVIFIMIVILNFFLGLYYSYHYISFYTAQVVLIELCFINMNTCKSLCSKSFIVTIKLTYYFQFQFRIN